MAHITPSYSSSSSSQVLDALTAVENPSPLIETLPLLLMGATSQEVVHVVLLLKDLVKQDLDLVLPVLATVFDLPLGQKLRKEFLGLAEEALSMVKEDDVPLVVGSGGVGSGRSSSSSSSRGVVIPLRRRYSSPLFGFAHSDSSTPLPLLHLLFLLLPLLLLLLLLLVLLLLLLLGPHPSHHH